MSDDLDLGPCCECETTENVRNIVMVDYKAPVPCHGWGCFVCHLPSDGASFVVCDSCLKKLDGTEQKPKFACKGYPAIDGRIEFEKLTESFKHDMSLHTEIKDGWSGFEISLDDFDDDDECRCGVIGCPECDDRALENFDCGLGKDGQCSKAGSEECDWECPFSS